MRVLAFLTRLSFFPEPGGFGNGGVLNFLPPASYFSPPSTRCRLQMLL
jgi:hypothetical protein